MLLICMIKVRCQSYVHARMPLDALTRSGCNSSLIFNSALQQSNDNAKNPQTRHNLHQNSHSHLSVFLHLHVQSWWLMSRVHTAQLFSVLHRVTSILFSIVWPCSIYFSFSGCRWHGSIYKLIWKDLLLFLVLYYAFFILYRYLPHENKQYV
jgi:Bestrophin, RFP-TM, chloride channel